MRAWMAVAAGGGLAGGGAAGLAKWGCCSKRYHVASGAAWEQHDAGMAITLLITHVRLRHVYGWGGSSSCCLYVAC